jgi:hypothetical protein
MSSSTTLCCAAELQAQPIKASLPSSKKCCSCKNTKPRAEFTKNKKKPDGLGHYCKPCHRAKDKAYRARRTPEQKAARWARERTPAKRLRDRVGRHRRLLGGDLTGEQVVAQKADFGDRCVRCTRHESETKGVLQIDHVVPPPEGPNSVGNIQSLCVGCHPLKGRKRTDYRPGWAASQIDGHSRLLLEYVALRRDSMLRTKGRPSCESTAAAYEKVRRVQEEKAAG